MQRRIDIAAEAKLPSFRVPRRALYLRRKNVQDMAHRCDGGDHAMWVRASDDELARVYAPPLLVSQARQNARRPVRLEALLNFGATRSALVPVRELSTSGALIDKKGTVLEIGAPVQCTLRCGHKDRPVELRLPATVARADSDAVALRFGSYDNVTYTHLVNVLYNA